MELVTRYLSLRVGIWNGKDPPLIKTEINGGPPFFNSHVYFDLPQSSPVMFKAFR